MEQQTPNQSQIAAERVALILAPATLKALEMDYMYFVTLLATLLILCWMSGRIKLGFKMPWNNSSKGESVIEK